MARPKKDESIRRTKNVMVRFTDVEYALVSCSAEQAGYPVAVYVRKQAITEKLHVHYNIVADIAELRDFAKQLSHTNGWFTIPLTKSWMIRIWQRMCYKRYFCTLQKIFLKFIEKTVTNSLLISLVVVEAVHMICFANNEKNCWKMSQTNQMPLRCRMMQQLAPITLNV